MIVRCACVSEFHSEMVHLTMTSFTMMIDNIYANFYLKFSVDNTISFAELWQGDCILSYAIIDNFQIIPCQIYHRETAHNILYPLLVQIDS